MAMTFPSSSLGDRTGASAWLMMIIGERWWTPKIALMGIPPATPLVIVP